MRILRFLLALTATALLLWSLSTGFRAGEANLPPLGAFLNPFSGFWANSESATGFPVGNTTPDIPGLSAPVEVVYDDLLVPHIFAQNMEDAARVQGYITATHRLWQMDITSRRASGRLSEVLGERTLALDRLMRRRGMVFAAENALLGWAKSPETMRLLQAYTEGVNAYMEQMSASEVPVEFKLLGYQPEPWSLLKTALVIESMADNLAAGNDDLAATNTLEVLGRETFDYLYPEWNPKQQPIIPDTGQWNALRESMKVDSAGKTGSVSYAPGISPEKNGMELPGDEYQVGSNNWAVSGSRTQSGRAILANDPHLSLSLPSIWFQVQIRTPQQSTYGVSLPGAPGIVIGFNEHIAWGMTNVGHDVSDWYRIKWKNTERTKYEVDGEQSEVKIRVEEIRIKGKPMLLDTVRYTVWGPVVYDNDPQHPLFDYALRWVTHDEPEQNEISLFLLLNSAKNHADYRTALNGYNCPAQNFVFATRSGDIAIQVQGRFPVRRREQGRFLQDGSRWANAWHNYIPQNEVPSMHNPTRGFVFSANQHSTPPSYPHYYLGNFDDFRGRHIHDRLAALHNATPDSMRNMQLDNFSQRAHDALPQMLHFLDRQMLDADGQKMADELAAWNFRYDADLMAPTLFESWLDSCYAKTWDEILALKTAKKDVLWPEMWRFIALMETDSNNIFFDHPATPVRETARDMVRESFQAMQTFFKQNPQKRVSWGEARPTNITHLARIAPFSRTGLRTGGHGSAPNAIKTDHGPSWRMIVDLGEQLKAKGVYPGGQSGNPGSRYYDNMVDTWAQGGYYDLLLLSTPMDNPDGRIVGKQTFSPK